MYNSAPEHGTDCIMKKQHFSTAADTKPLFSKKICVLGHIWKYFWKPMISRGKKSWSSNIPCWPVWDCSTQIEHATKLILQISQILQWKRILSLMSGKQTNLCRAPSFCQQYISQEAAHTCHIKWIMATEGLRQDWDNTAAIKIGRREFLAMVQSTWMHRGINCKAECTLVFRICFTF